MSYMSWKLWVNGTLVDFLEDQGFRTISYPQMSHVGQLTPGGSLTGAVHVSTRVADIMSFQGCITDV